MGAEITGLPGRALEGLLVVTIEQAVAAPFCTSRLADAGARVIKVERPEGDFARGYDDATAAGSSYFVWLNRGKQSVVLDLRDAAARGTLERIIARADVLVQNLKPGALDRLGLSTATLCRRHPRLICCSISGYGADGPYAARKAYDLLIQADSGLCWITGGVDEPARVGISIVDIATGATAHAAILEALLARGHTGRGADIRISMFDVIADWMAVPLLNADAGKPPQRVGLAHPSIAPYGVFVTRDGRRVLISVQSDREWQTLCRDVMQTPNAIQDERFATNVARVRNRGATDGLVKDAFASCDASELIPRLAAADMAFSEVNDLAGLACHPHLRRVEVASAAGPVALPAPAVMRSALGAVPALGEHTVAILTEFADETADE